MKNKKTLYLATALGLIGLMVIFPASLAFSGTVLPDEIVVIDGSQKEGRLSDLYEVDGDYVWWQATSPALFQWLLRVKIYFPEKSDVGEGNTLTVKFQFEGGSILYVVIYYTDDTYDTHNELSTSWKTVIYDLDPYKIVDCVGFANHEWWLPGNLYVDYLVVDY
jgi:hypothetical protein